MTEKSAIRRVLVVQGQVQGVGFRPYIWRLATSENLTGNVRNTSAGVRIEIQGEPDHVDSFEQRLGRELPPLAKIVSLRKRASALVEGEDSFQIEHSFGHAGQHVLISPDVGICDDCLADIREAGNPRQGYAFANCVNCGPRYTITKSIPYDRPTTTMACFEMCENCRDEYSNPADRRFHAQPIACPVCGPGLWFTTHKGPSVRTLPTAENRENALERAGEMLLCGGIVAIKGLGGFHLACDARNADAVARLRRRKQRPHKALALMVANAEDGALFCKISPAEKILLEGPEKPIVLCPSLPASPWSPVDGIAPDTDKYGLVLPYTPLHVLLFDWLKANGQPHPALVMTSGNAGGEPICRGNREALAGLAHIADGWLLHDRDILLGVDDSVLETANRDERGNPDNDGPQIVFTRRSRGYTPRPIPLAMGENMPTVLGAGAELKATFCLTRGNMAFTSQHLGDLMGLSTHDFYLQTLEHMQNILEVEPRLIVRDLHPDFISSRIAEELGQKNNLPVYTLQHHAAHAASVLGEHGHFEPALALCLDGLGLGEDGGIWGGELLLMDLGNAHWRRMGRLAPFRLPGGDAAAREPWRIARAMQKDRSKEPPWARGENIAAIDEMLARNVNCPLTSSCGRLFDAVAAALGLCSRISYEGQAAIRLEKEASKWFAANESGAPCLWKGLVLDGEGSFVEIDSHCIFAHVEENLKSRPDIPFLAASFHWSLAHALVEMAAMQAKRLNLHEVALSGGVMQNNVMLKLLPKFLRAMGLQPLLPIHLPPGDGGISFGQAVWGMCRQGQA